MKQIFKNCEEGDLDVIKSQEIDRALRYLPKISHYRNILENCQLSTVHSFGKLMERYMTNQRNLRSIVFNSVLLCKSYQNENYLILKTPNLVIVCTDGKLYLSLRDTLFGEFYYTVKSCIPLEDDYHLERAILKASSWPSLSRVLHLERKSSAVITLENSLVSPDIQQSIAEFSLGSAEIWNYKTLFYFSSEDEAMMAANIAPSYTGYID